MPAWVGALFFLALAATRGGEPAVPRTWDDAAVTTLELPLADERHSPIHVPAEYYYQIPARTVWKSFPVYHPDREPEGYVERLRGEEPQVAFDPSKLAGEAEWARAGELVFDAPNSLEPLARSLVRDRDWYRAAGIPVARDGSVPFFRYVIREKGKIEVTSGGCVECHTRVMPDGAVIKGAQGNYPFERAGAYLFRKFPRLDQARTTLRNLFAAPWVRPDPMAAIEALGAEELAAAAEAIPPGVLGRRGSSLFHPPQVPDLIGVRERRFLDHTGLVRQRSIGDLMRYSALNQGMDQLARYGDFRPAGDLPDPKTRSRYSDEQLYALALYLYSLRPPENPHRADASTERGRRVFEREGCAACHTPPLYSNNKLTPAAGFTPRDEQLRSDEAMPVSVGTDPSLALRTRRGTGYYKVPSLRGVWYRGPFEHNGSVATLEDWFDPARLRGDYVPTGFRGPGPGPRAVPGHAFGLRLTDPDRRALIAFLKTL